MTRRTILCALSLSLGFSSSVLAQETVIQTVERIVDIAAAKAEGHAERIMAEASNGSIELVVDATLDAPHIEATFTVEGEDEKDVARRAELVKLFAERAADQTLVVRPIFPGKEMPRDTVRVRIVVPKSGDCTLRSANGALTVTGTAGKLKLNAKNGAIRVERHTGSVDANAANGAIEILHAGGEVRASAANGAITVSLADGNDLPFEIETRTGSVRVEVGTDFDGIVKMHTTGGELSVSDSGKRARTPQSTDHARTIEIGAAGVTSEARSTTGSVKLTIRAK